MQFMMDLKAYEKEQTQPTSEQLEKAQTECVMISDADEEEPIAKQTEEKPSKPRSDNREQPIVVEEEQPETIASIQDVEEK